MDVDAGGAAVSGRAHNLFGPARLAKRCSVAIAAAIAIYALIALATGEHTAWLVTSAGAWTVLLMGSAFWLARDGVLAGAAVCLTGTTVARLLSTVRSESDFQPAANSTDILLQVETGRGVPGFEALGIALVVMLSIYFALVALADVRRDAVGAQDRTLKWTWTFLRVYLGVMFVPHFAGHVLAGPHHFAIYTAYFQSLGLPLPSAQLVLAGAVEIAVAVGLALGLLTRVAAVVGAIYLFLTMLLGGHFPIGYVWILPNGGWEFGIFWAVAVGLYAITGATGPSADAALRPKLARAPGLLRTLVA